MGPGTPRDDETNSPLPLPFKKKQGSNVSPTNFIEEGDDRILEPGAKVVVTEIALDDWIIQQYGYSLENFPRNVTDTNMNTKLFDELKKKYIRFCKEREQKALTPRSKAMLYPNNKNGNFKQPAVAVNHRPRSSHNS